jgi:DNA invertase Pin-like site-specific DNA recombinase
MADSIPSLRLAAPFKPTDRAAFYLRVSTTSQKVSGKSLTTQRKELTAIAEAAGLPVAEVYEDDYSATTMDRPELTRLLRDLQAGRVQVVLFTAVDRSSREGSMGFAFLIGLIQHYGGRYLIAGEEAITPMDEMMLLAKATFAKIEHQLIYSRMRTNLENKVKDDKLPVGCGRAPFGYQWGERRRSYLIDEIKAEVVRRIFDEVAAGRTLGQVVVGLVRDGVERPTGGLGWTKHTLATIVRNPIYKGEPEAFRWSAPKGGKLRMRPVEERVKLLPVAPIVEAEVWQAANDVLAHNRAAVRRGPIRLDDHLLRGGYGECAYCGRALLPAPNNGQPGYACSGRRRKLPLCREGATIRAALLDDAAWAEVLAAIEEPERLVAEVARQAEMPHIDEGELIVAHKLIAKYEGELDEIAIALKERKAGALKDRLYARADEIEASLAEARAREAAVIERKARLKAAAANLSALLGQVDEWRAKARNATFAQKRHLLRAFDVRVKLWKVGDRAPRWEVSITPPPAPADNGVLANTSATISQYTIDRARVAIPLPLPPPARYTAG